MEYRYLGSSGLQVSALSFGSWVTFGSQIGEDIAYDCMMAAYEAGVNFFDTAEVYADGKSETRWATSSSGPGGSDRIWCSPPRFSGAAKASTIAACRASTSSRGSNAALARLQLDYVDLVFCHRPDFHTPIEETVRAMTHLVNQGKAFYWGTSEWSAQQIMEAYTIARQEHLIPPLMEQPQYNMFRARARRERIRAAVSARSAWARRSGVRWRAAC